MLTIRELAILTLQALRAVPHVGIGGLTAYSLAQLALGSTADCVFFNNGRRVTVAVWVVEPETVAAITERHPEWIYAYRLNGEETIIKRPLPSPGQSYIYWVDLGEALDVERVLPGWDTEARLKHLIESWYNTKVSRRTTRSMESDHTMGSLREPEGGTNGQV